MSPVFGSEDTKMNRRHPFFLQELTSTDDSYTTSKKVESKEVGTQG